MRRVTIEWRQFDAMASSELEVLSIIPKRSEATNERIVFELLSSLKAPGGAVATLIRRKCHAS